MFIRFCIYINKKILRFRSICTIIATKTKIEAHYHFEIYRRLENDKSRQKRTYAQ